MKSSPHLLSVSSDIFLLKHRNDNEEVEEFQSFLPDRFIVIHFGIQGKTSVVFRQGTYQRELYEGNVLLLYNPNEQLPLHLYICPLSSIVSIAISIEKLHQLFSAQAEHIDFLSAENQNNKYYSQTSIPSRLMDVLYQIDSEDLHHSVKMLYLKGKIYELLSLFFNPQQKTESCPFLNDEENRVKIRKAKDILVRQMTTPPHLPELAHQVGLNLKKLKTGFKQMYGTTVYGFLNEHRMKTAQQLLKSNHMNINEISSFIGYSNPSHFIAAFKKRFGVTPRRYALKNSQNLT